MKKKEILNLLLKSQLFTDNIKFQLSEFYDQLNPKQKKILYQALNSEKALLIYFLRSLKNKLKLDFLKIKNAKESILRKKISSLENQEDNSNNFELKTLTGIIDNM